MMVKNLAQLKRVISAKNNFRIVEHFIKPEFSGQVRTPNVIQTNGFYSVETGKPDSPVSTANGGRGYWLDYGKASDWTFDGDRATLRKRDGSPVFTITFC